MKHKKFEGDIIGQVFDSLEEQKEQSLREQEISFQERQTIASEKANEIAERALIEAKRANEIAERALKKSKTANIISIISVIVAIFSIGITILATAPGILH